MGKRGPAATPTAILKLRGSELARQREKAGEPEPEKGIPECPEHIRAEAKHIWHAATKILDDMGVLTLADGFPLERYASYFADWRMLDKVKDAFFSSPNAIVAGLRDDEKRAILRNVWSESHRLDAALKQIESQYGLTPAARARLSCLVNGNRNATDQDDREAMFFGGAAS